MKQTIALATLASACLAKRLQGDHHAAFQQWQAKFGKTYDTYEEYQMRLDAFKAKNDLINSHNSSGQYTYTLGHNHMSDWTDEEYTNYLTYIPEPEAWWEEQMSPSGAKKGVAYTPLDWRQYGFVTDVKDQGACGSCWAFSSTGALEGAHARQTSQLLSFSEQQLVDCVTGCFGCFGGNVDRAFSHYQKHPAIEEGTYPYTHKNGNCQESSLPNSGVTDGGHMRIKSKSPDAMKDGLSWWPISVAIQANKSTFQSYSGGLYNDASCGTNLDHATLVVGWGIDAATGAEYWIMKNSWGLNWGEQGYMRLQIEAGKGICGIQKQPSAPKDVN